MQKKLVSIIIPVYNCERYIEETIQSVKNQTYNNWELVIVDDFSLDNTLKLIKDNIKDIKEKTILIEMKKNVGAAKSRNKGLDCANGNFIAFLDSDDIWKKDKLEKQIKFMEENNYAFTYTGFKYLRGNKLKDVKAPKFFTYKKALKNTMILTSTVMVDIEKVDKELLKMPNIKRGQDTATWWNILREGHIAYGLNEKLTYYRQVKKSLSSNKMKAIKRTWNLYRKVEGFEIFKSLYYFCFYAMNATIRRIGKYYEREKNGEERRNTR